MKPELSELRKWLQTLLKKQNRARLALVLGCIAMALILLSELFPAKAPAAPQAVSPEEGTYKIQLEQQLTELIEQVQGAGKTTVMLTLESGEETVYALDTLSGQTQTQQNGTMNGLKIDTPALIRFGELTHDEYFVSEQTASAGVKIVNESDSDPIVMLKHFGPENPDLNL